MSKRSPFFLVDGRTVRHVAVHETYEEAHMEILRTDEETAVQLKGILARAKSVGEKMGMSRGSLLLMLAVGALAEEEMDAKSIHTAVDFISGGLALKLHDITFND